MVRPLPWTLWADGVVPVDWWNSSEFMVALHVWWPRIQGRTPRLRELLAAFHRSADAARVLDERLPLIALAAYQKQVGADRV